MKIDEYKNLVQKTLEGYFEEQKAGKIYEPKVWDAMAYTTLLAGKKLRAILCLETCKMFSGSPDNALATACAIEMLHAQSLIHDDLPCMDNDDLRRGKPSNHKVFGEAMAVLAGDALISFGAQTIINKTPSNVDKKTVLEVLGLYLKAAGANGIVAGQCADIEAENKGSEIDLAHLEYIHKFKTAALFECAVVSGAMLGGADDRNIELMKRWASAFGLAFQIYDDILDVTSTTEELGKTAGKDEKENKATFVGLFGLDGAKEKFKTQICKSYDILKQTGIASDIYDNIINSMQGRIN